MKKHTLILSVFIFSFIFLFFNPNPVKAQTIPICSSFTMTLKMGMNNTEVKCLQQTLNNNGFKISSSGVGSPGLETTYFGNLTNSAVKVFQLAKGLVADGIFGLLSRTALGNSIGVFPLGCTSSIGYSTLTGALCSGATTFPLGCTSSIGYSPLTGSKCDGSVLGIFPLGCTSSVGYSTTTGMLCSGNSSGGGSGSSSGGGGGGGGGGGTSNSAPIVTLTSPTNDTQYTAPATVEISATATDSDGTISKVEFYNGITLLYSDTTFPYDYIWTDVATGNYSISAIAYDNSDYATSSIASNIVVNAPNNLPPTVFLTSPTNNAIYTAPATVTLSATATPANANGSITKVEFYSGSTLLNTDTISPFSYNYINVPTGNYSLTAKAYDDNNLSTTSSAVNIVVNNVANIAPTVSLTSPPNNSTYTAPATVIMTATASDSDGTITQVNFYNGNTLLYSDTGTPYSYTWNNVSAGSYSLTARAKDNLNAITTSTAVNIIVNTPANVPPIVSLTSPLNGKTYTAPATVSLAATATDGDGTISRVDFYNGATLLSSNTSSPYSYSWTNVPIGNYSLVAKAYDDLNAVTTSLVSNIGVENTIINNADPFKFGMNSVFNFDPVIKKIIADPTEYSLYAPLFSKYHIDHLRYPGGIPTRYYFWDNINLIKNATDAISQYYYAQGTASGIVQGDTYANYNFTIDPNNYTQFLNFVKTAGIVPIIQMNTLFYIDNGVIYQTESFQKNFDAFPLEADRWIKIATYLNAQMDYTHSIFPEPLIWELGNEDNAIFDAPEYGLIVSNYADIVKARYPNDKVIAAMSGGEMKTARKAQWNEDFIAYLNTNGALQKVDYFAPHYYIGTTFVSQLQTDINTRIKSPDFTTFFDDMKSNFPVGYTPKFSITEFSELLHSDDNINYNTQLDAMLMWDELLKFHSDPIIASVTKLGFTAEKNALFFDRTISKDFVYVDQSRQDSDLFAYIPPQTDAVKIFLEATGNNILDFLINDSYELLVTQTDNTKYLQVLNYNDTPQTIDISQYGQGTYTTYTLPALTTYYWDAEANKTTGNTTSTMTLPTHSFTTIIIQ